MSKSATISLIFGLFGFLIDRAHKFFQIDIAGWSGGEMVKVTSFLDYVLIWNRGVSFGLFKNLPPYFLSIIIGAALLILVIWWVKEKNTITRIGLALCVGGAISNIIDRFLYGAVADFFHLHILGRSVFVNNIADIVIFIGVTLLILEMVLPSNKIKSNSEKS